jgi:tetratricopeptide (TPR) repeat protein
MSIVVQIAQFLRDPELTHLRAQELIDFSNQQGSLLFLSHGHFLKGWARFEAARVGITLPGDQEVTAAAEMQVATTAMEKANQEHIRTESRLHRTIFPVMLAEALGAVGRAEEGLALLRDCQRLIDAQGDRRWQAELFRVQGDLELGPAASRAGSVKSARTSFEKAIRVAHGQEAKSLELRATTSYARLLCQDGEKQRARELLEAILGWFKQGHTTRDFLEAKALRDSL